MSRARPRSSESLEEFSVSQLARVSGALRHTALRLLFQRTRVADGAAEWAALASLSASELEPVLSFRHDAMFGRTLLHEAVCNNNLAIVAVLLRLGAPIDAENDPIYKWTPLHEAVVHASAAMTALLLRSGADTTRLTTSEQTAYDLLSISRYAAQKMEKEQLFRVFMAAFDEHAPTRAQFCALPVAVRERMRTLLLCWAHWRTANRRCAHEAAAANVGHCDSLVLKNVLHHLWRFEQRALLDQFAVAEQR